METKLNFLRVIKVGIETEEAAKAVKETDYVPKTRSVNKVKQSHNKDEKYQQSNDTYFKLKCYRCGRFHKATCFPYREVKCDFCDRKEHLEFVCEKKHRQLREYRFQPSVKKITKAALLKTILGEFPDNTFMLILPISIQNWQFMKDLDSVTTGNFFYCSSGNS